MLFIWIRRKITSCILVVWPEVVQELIDCRSLIKYMAKSILPPRTWIKLDCIQCWLMHQTFACSLCLLKSFAAILYCYMASPSPSYQLSGARHGECSGKKGWAQQNSTYLTLFKQSHFLLVYQHSWMHLIFTCLRKQDFHYHIVCCRAEIIGGGNTWMDSIRNSGIVFALWVSLSFLWYPPFLIRITFQRAKPL